MISDLIVYTQELMEKYFIVYNNLLVILNKKNTLFASVELALKLSLYEKACW